MLPVLLLFLQLPLLFEGPVVSFYANLVGLLGALFAVPCYPKAARHVRCQWRKASSWRRLTFWRAIFYCHVAVVPPWFFFGRTAEATFAFPLLQGLGIALGALRLLERVVGASDFEPGKVSENDHGMELP